MLRSVVLILAASTMLAVCSAYDRTMDFFTGSDDKAEATGTAASQALADAAASDDAADSLAKSATEAAETALADAAANAIDSRVDNSRTSVSLSGVKDGNNRYEIRNITGLSYGTDDSKQTFFQGGVANSNGHTVANLGIGQRYLNDDETVMTGINAFYDYNIDYGHQRASIGAELKMSAFEITANSYSALTKWKKGKNGNQERPLDGYEVEFGGQLPYIPTGMLYAKTWKWDVPDSSNDIKGTTYSLAFNQTFANGLSVELGRKDYDGLQKDEDFVTVKFRILSGEAPAAASGPFFSDRMFERSSMRSRLLDEVRRNNDIVVQTEFSAGVSGV